MLRIEDFERLLIMVDFQESCSTFDDAIAISSHAVEFVLAHWRLEKGSSQVECALAVSGVFIEIRIVVALFSFGEL